MFSAGKSIKIDAWQGDWGLPSIDVDCLRLMAYAKIADLDLEVRFTNNPFWSSKGALPVFYIGNQVYTSFEELVTYLKSKNIWPDYGLNAKEHAETTAYTNMLKEKLLPALLYVWWLDDKNCLRLTRPWYSKVLPFPFNFYYPNKYQNESRELIEAIFGDDDSKSDIETKVYGAAEKCLTALSVRLGDSDFMFGNHPRGLDATLYSYLAPLLKAPFPNPTLQNHLKACTNLFKFVTRINQRYFPTYTQDYENKRQEEMKNKPQTTNESEFPNKRRNQILAVLFAVTAMSFYALSVDIVQIPQRLKFWIEKSQNKSKPAQLVLLWNWTRMLHSVEKREPLGQ